MKKKVREIKNFDVTIEVSDFIFKFDVEAYDEVDAKKMAKEAAIEDVHYMSNGKPNFVRGLGEYNVENLVRRIKYSHPLVLSNPKTEE